MNISRTIASVLFICYIGLVSCGKDENQVPNVLVDIYIDINDAQFSDLVAVGGWTYVTGGARGIVIYRKSIDEFKAFDRNSTFEPNKGCRVWVDPSDFYLDDECSDSRFQLIDGLVVQGPAVQQLKEYNTSFAGSILHIFNF